MDFSKETEERVRQLQMFEQNMQNILAQKQNVQGQTLEVDNALEELKNAEGKVYKIVGTVMIDSTKERLEKDLNERKEVLELRLKSLKKQEDSFRERADILQKEVMKEIEEKEKNNEGSN
ncbi:prefoldin subunit beta [archaeon]|jgi:prefoldin beta subunit|nr:prefoldin subunit beta [archaeon]MBT4397314.1 prefoldin subunit beta [archaeon]MBT4440694.1 prefoldin subunit beta [archaeon]